MTTRLLKIGKALAMVLAALAVRAMVHEAFGASFLPRPCATAPHCDWSAFLWYGPDEIIDWDRPTVRQGDLESLDKLPRAQRRGGTVPR